MNILRNNKIFTLSMTSLMAEKKMANASRSTALNLFAMLLLLTLTACGGGSNTAPVADAQSVTIDEDTPVAITLSGSDVDGDSLTYNTSNPAHGSLSGSGASITYTPDVNYYGSDSFTFTVNDGTVDSGVATVNININPLNDLVTFQAAAVVIGQADFTGTSPNQGGSADANTIYIPYGNPGMANGVLYLPDYVNNRLLGFNTVPTVNNTPADFVLGQPDFTTTSAVLSATGFSGTGTTVFNGNKMFVADYKFHRILIWNTIPTSGGVPADIVLGQDDFTTGSSAGSCTATGLRSPETVSVAQGKIVVTDSFHNRVLIWNSVPTSNNTAPDIVLGQQDFTHCAANDNDNNGVSDVASAATFDAPAGVWTDGTKLVVLDRNNNRVLIWNSFPTSNFTSADVVLGQADFANTISNDDDQDGVSDAAPTARTLNYPYQGVYSNGRQLYVADHYNARVLIWNDFPTSNFTPADVVLGQANFTLNAANDSDGDGVRDTASAQTLNGPAGIYFSGDQLIVGDSENNRYLIYDE